MDDMLTIQQKFEHDFFERTYPSVVRDISVAFSEIVANAWDAGATEVRITIPNKFGEDIIIEDNGAGMTGDEFANRWMVISYNRVTHQGDFVEHIINRVKIKRLAYGRNGVGRHAMICFDDYYTVETSKKGEYNSYGISALSSGTSALSVVEHITGKSDKNGTKLTVKAIKRLPNARELRSMLSYRFLFDPEFQIYVNNELVDPKKYINPTKEENIPIGDNFIDLSIYEVPEGEKITASTGIAFWVGTRLIGNPSWVIDGQRVEDARRKFAQKHIIVVKVDFLRDDILYDWSAFRNSEKVNEVNKAVINYIRKFRAEYYRGQVDKVKDEIIRQNLDEIETLSLPSRYELKEFFDLYLTEKPEVDTDEFNIIVKALINILNSRNGLSLLSKLSEIDNKQIATLDEVLAEWSIFDVKTVLDEIDGRIKVINAIEKLCNDKTINELHILHPLITQAKWLFGIEYDNLNYTSNKTISTVIKQFFNNERKMDVDINWSKRPDLVIGADFSIGVSSIDDVDENEILKTDRILIIELKRGGSEIGRDEINQADEYVDFVYNGTAINSKPKIKAFVIGDSVKATVATKKTSKDAYDNEYAHIHVYTYAELVRTAERRLLNLKEKLVHRYNEMNIDDYLQKILNEPKQMKLET